MARRRISVEKIKEVIRYGVTTELSERAIGRALKVSRTAVTKYLECFRGSGLTWEQAQELPDSELLSVLEGNRMARTSARYERLAERFPMSMHIDHKAGEKLFVDYAGDRLAIVDPDSGKEQPVETFVAILGASELTYVEVSATQQGDDWIRSNERALRYCGGGTQVIVPDNLRSAVSRSDPYEPGINATFDAFAQHYGVVIMPARVRQARDKALVENAVRLTYQRIYAPLRDRTFHSLDELNAAIRPLLEQHNGRRFQRLPYSRLSTLVVRQYQQAVDQALKRRCLDLIDQMEEAGCCVARPGPRLVAGEMTRSVAVVVPFRARAWSGTVEQRNGGRMRAGRQPRMRIMTAGASRWGCGRRGRVVGEIGGRHRDERC